MPRDNLKLENKIRKTLEDLLDHKSPSVRMYASEKLLKYFIKTK
jgi:hypothetical protein